MFRKLRQQFSTNCLPTGNKWKKNTILSGLDGRPQDNASILSRHRSWIKMNSSQCHLHSRSLVPEHRGVIVGYLELELEGQSCLVDDVDRGFMKIDQLGHMTKEDPEKYCFNRFFPIARRGTSFSKQFQKNFGNLLVKLLAFHQLAPAFRSNSWRLVCISNDSPKQNCSVSHKIVGISLLSFSCNVNVFFYAYCRPCIC